MRNYAEWDIFNLFEINDTPPPRKRKSHTSRREIDWAAAQQRRADSKLREWGVKRDTIGVDVDIAWA